MIKKTVSYEDFNGNEVTEELHFHMTKAELLALEYESDTSFTEYLQKMINNGDPKTILSVMRKLVGAAYGKKSFDGTKFIKDEDATKEFLSSEAFSELLFGILNDPSEAQSFFEGILPANLVKQAKEELKTNPDLVNQTASDVATGRHRSQQ